MARGDARASTSCSAWASVDPQKRVLRRNMKLGDEPLGSERCGRKTRLGSSGLNRCPPVGGLGLAGA
jgi:hypothetical protein